LLTRRALEEKQLNTVRFELINPAVTMNEPLIAAGRKVIKPIDGTGSAGVRIVEDGEWIPVSTEVCILEDFVGGREFSCETFSVNGKHFKLAITEKILSGASGVVEVGHIIDPSEDIISPAHWVYLQQVLDAIGLCDGPGHIEFKLHETEIHIIECHNRPGGDRIWNLVEIATGFDMVSASVDLLLGMPVNVQLHNRSCAAIHFFEYSPGVVRHCRKWQGSLAPDIHWLDWKLFSGMDIAPITSSSDRYGGFIISASTKSSLLKRIAEVERQFEVEVS
jgi:predicted ATP-grasp superfamily ATP-dependent carboligase